MFCERVGLLRRANLLDDMSDECSQRYYVANTIGFGKGECSTIDWSILGFRRGRILFALLAF